MTTISDLCGAEYRIAKPPSSSRTALFDGPPRSPRAAYRREGDHSLDDTELAIRDEALKRRGREQPGNHTYVYFFPGDI